MLPALFDMSEKVRLNKLLNESVGSWRSPMRGFLLARASINLPATGKSLPSLNEVRFRKQRFPLLGDS